MIVSVLQVAIKSLPQDWLWCETWCDDESKKVAKTIDLCNNPKTKEPKLTAARRILPEWEGYDNEIKNFMDRFLAQKRGHEKSGAAASQSGSQLNQNQAQSTLPQRDDSVMSDPSSDRAPPTPQDQTQSTTHAKEEL